MASALFNTMRNLGGAIGIACINTWINDRTNKHWHDLADNLTTANPRVQIWLANVVNHIGSNGFDPALNTQRALAILAGKVRAEAVTMAFADTFYLMAALFFGAVIFVPLLRRPAPAAHPHGAPGANVSRKIGCDRASAGKQREAPARKAKPILSHTTCETTTHGSHALGQNE